MDNNHLKLNINKTKELVVDYQRNRRPPVPVIIQGEEVERVNSYKYLGVQITKKLDWTHNTNTLFRNYFGMQIQTQFLAFCARLQSGTSGHWLANSLFSAAEHNSFLDNYGFEENQNC